MSMFTTTTLQMAELDDLNESNENERLKWENRPVYVIYEGNKIIGYTITDREADAICDKNPKLQWDICKRNAEIVRARYEVLIHSFIKS